MTDLSTQPLLKQLDDAHLPIFAMRLTEWLIADLNKSKEPVPDFTESRAKALLRAAAVVDDPTLHDFARLVEGSGTAVRLALHDLLQETGLVEDEECPLQACRRCTARSGSAKGSSACRAGTSYRYSRWC